MVIINDVWMFNNLWNYINATMHHCQMGGAWAGKKQVVGPGGVAAERECKACLKYFYNHKLIGFDICDLKSGWNFSIGIFEDFFLELLIISIVFWTLYCHLPRPDHRFGSKVARTSSFFHWGLSFKSWLRVLWFLYCLKLCWIFMAAQFSISSSLTASEKLKFSLFALE